MRLPDIPRRMKDLCRLKYFALATEKACTGWIKSCIKALETMPRDGIATHVHREGAAACNIQEVAGHKSLDATMRYFAAQPARIRSPLNTPS
jgi:hypothetical protein